MLLVIPHSDRASSLYRHIFSLGGVARHDVLLVGEHRQVEEIEKSLNVLKGAFANADVFTGDHTYDSKNKLFHDVAHYLDLVGCTDPWYWFDETCCPLRDTWLTEVAKEYFASKRPFLGATEPCAEVDPATGKIAEEPPRLIASSIYPPDLYHRSTLVRRLGYGPRETPWHVTMRFEMRREAAVSKLIQNRAGTYNYRQNNSGKLIFSERENFENGPVRSETAVIAHVADGSVADALNPKRKRNEPESISA